MKKLIITIVALSLFVGVTGVFAQTAATGLVGKGVKLGLNMAKFTGADVTDAKMNLGFVVGGYITYAFSDLFALQPELQFNMKGSKAEVGTATYKAKLSYIEIPVLVKVLLSGGEKFKPNFYAGPEFAFLMSASASADPEPPGFESDIKDNYKSSDFGLIGGVGVDYLMGASMITFDLRYDVGLSKIEDFSPQPDVKNSAITFLVGYGF